MEDTYLLTMRCPVYRRRDSHSGSRTELETLIGDVKGKGTSGSNREAESTDALPRGGLLRSVCLTANAFRWVEVPLSPRPRADIRRWG